MTRILLVDDYPVVLSGLKQILTDTIADAVFGETDDGQGALRLAREQDWDVIVLDISLPDMSGLDVLKKLHLERPRTPVLVLSMYSEDQFALRMLRAGAAGYLTKQAAAKELATAIRKVLAGGRYVSASLAERLAAAVGLRTQPQDAPHEALSDREYQVFRRLASGMTVKAIGEELSLSPQTVSTHRARILEKMGFQTNADLTRYAIQARLLD